VVFFFFSFFLLFWKGHNEPRIYPREKEKERERERERERRERKRRYEETTRD